MKLITFYTSHVENFGKDLYWDVRKLDSEWKL